MNNTTETDFSFDTKDLLESTADLLYDYLVRSSKHDGKMRFKKLNETEQHFVAEMPTRDGSSAKIYLKLDQSEFIGELKFTTFKNFIGRLLGLIAHTLKENKDIPIREEAKGQHILLDLPAAMKSDNQLNVLMLSFNLQQVNEITLELMFFEPTQFDNSNSEQ